MKNSRDQECLNRTMTLNKTCSQPAVQLCIHGPVFGVSCFIWMAYLSLGVMACPPWPPPVFCYWGRRAAEAAARPSEFRNVGCKMCVSGGTAGEGSESVWSLESLGVLFFTHTHTHTFNHSHIPTNLLLLRSHTHSPRHRTCLTQCIWKQTRPASHAPSPKTNCFYSVGK